MSRGEFAKYLGVSIQTVDRARKKGMPTAKIMGVIRIPVNKAVAWMQTESKNQGDLP